MEQIYVVNYLDDKESMDKFLANHERLNDLTREEMLEMIVIYNQLYLKAIEVVDNQRDLLEWVQYFLERI